MRLQLRRGSGEAVTTVARSRLWIALIEDPFARRLPIRERTREFVIVARRKLHQPLAWDLLREMDAVVFSFRRTPPGLAAVARMCAQVRTARILVVQQNATARAGYRFLRVGARGYLAAANIGGPGDNFGGFRDSLQVVCAGGMIVDPELARAVWKQFAAVECAATSLSAKEPPSAEDLDLLRYMAKGFSDRELGEMLAVRKRSLRAHLSSIYRKLNVQTRVQAMLCAVRAGWIEP